MLGFTLEIMGRISEEDKKMSGSWICFLLVMCKWFEGPVTLPLSLPNMFVVPWKWLMGSVSNKFARAPKFCFRTDWGREYPRARTVTYLVVFWNQWVPIPLLSKNGISSSEWQRIMPCFTEEKWIASPARRGASFAGLADCIDCMLQALCGKVVFPRWSACGMMNGLSPEFAAKTGWTMLNPQGPFGTPEHWAQQV